jgi:hypothetical protein
MGLIKQIYNKQNHINTYWMLGDFVLNLNKEVISFVFRGYRDYNARVGGKEPADDRVLDAPIDKNDRDLIDYEELKINYKNNIDKIVKIELSMKIKEGTTINPDIQRLIKKLLDYGYFCIKQTDDFKDALDRR